VVEMAEIRKEPEIDIFKAWCKACRTGAIRLPPMPAFYFHPKTIEDLVNHTVGKVLDLFGIDHDLFKRWGSGVQEKI